MRDITHEGYNGFLRSPGRATCSGDIIAICPDSYELYIVANGVVWSRGDSEAPIERQSVKNSGDGTSSLEISGT